MQWHTLQTKDKKQAKKRVGRGGKRGKTSGRGTKGQLARAGNKRRPEWRDIIKKIPKARGYRFPSIQDEVFAVNLEALEKVFASGDSVTRATLLEKELIKRRGGKMPRVKVLGKGVLSKKLVVSGIPVSASAKKAIEAAGGAVTESIKPKQNKKQNNKNKNVII